MTQETAVVNIPDSRFVTRQQAEKILGVHAHTIRTWVKIGKLQAERTSNAKNAKFLIFVDSIKDFLQNRGR